MCLARRSFASVVVSALAVLSCSAGTTDHASPPSSIEYDIEFPSTAAAVAADTIQVFIFSTATPKTDCPSLLVARESGSNLPATLEQTEPIALCDVLTGAKGQIPGVGFGNVAFLVVAQRAAVDYFTGCFQTTLTATSGPVAIQLEQAVPSVHIPLTNCTTVSEHCSNSCTVGGDGGP